MKTLIISCCLASLSLAATAESVAPFRDERIEPTALRLLEQAAVSRPRAIAPPADFVAHRTPTARSALARMPIVAPAPDVDYKMAIKAPDESVDYKLRVKRPASSAEK